MQHRLPGLDHLRALAITLVFLYHYLLFPHPDWTETPGRFGWTGVDLFFVLSGFLITSQILKAIHAGDFSFRSYFLHRSLRILPAYWAVLALYFLLPAFREWEALPRLWKFLTFTQNFGLDLRTSRTFSHAWSLCIEEQFYLLLPVALVAIRHKEERFTWLLPALVVAGLIARLLSWNHLVAPAMDTPAFGVTWYKWIYYPTYTRLDGLVAGISMAFLFRSPRFRAVLSRYSTALLCAGLLCLTAAYVLCETPTSFPATMLGFPLIALGFGLIMPAAVCDGGLLNRRSFRLTRIIATLSYALYLTHKSAIHFGQILAEKLGWESADTKTFLLCGVVSVAFAMVLHSCVERPFNRLRNRLRGGKPKGLPCPHS